ncbi:hypothetical protein FACS1894132_12650 [Clostridia bacterium]|nr:hypothetical protein FACS1894132_12650 [Clostridia bacterium]
MIKSAKNPTLKKVIAGVLSFTMLTTNLALNPLFTHASQTEIAPYEYGIQIINENERVYYDKDFQVTYSITSSWYGGQSVSFVIKNTSDHVIENWALFYDFGVDEPTTAITNIWNVKIEQNEYFSYLTHSGTNAGDLQPGESVYAGYILPVTEKFFPGNIEALQSRKFTNEFSANFTEIQDNYHNFNAKLNIKNTTDKNIFKPEISFNSNFELLNDWAYDILSTENEVSSDGVFVGTKNEIKPKYDKIIFAPNESISVTIKGSKTLDSAGSWTFETPEISDVSLSEVVISAEEYITRDSDYDGLPDYYELLIGTNKYAEDTDGDGLPDGYEILTLGTDPILLDTDSNAILDSDEDFDHDNLTNFEEYLLETNPMNADTDEDELDDGDDNHPLNSDWDNDKILDGYEDELGFDNELQDTDGNGIIDGDEIITQTLDLGIKEPTSVVPSVEVTGIATLYNGLTAQDISDNTAVSDLPYIVGEPFDFLHDDNFNFESGTLTFKVSDEILEENDINDLRIAHFSYEDGSVTLFDTEITDINSISADVEHFSVYFVINVSKFIEVIESIKSDVQDIVDGLTTSPVVYKGHSYAIFTTKMTWDEAKEFCESKGGHLATITSQEEQEFINNLMNGKPDSYYYLGGSDVEQEGLWRWVTGETWVYGNWNSGEPNDGSASFPTEDYLGCYYNGKWNDGAISAQAFICEWESTIDTNGKYRVILSNYTTVYLDKNPVLGDYFFDTDGDGLADLSEIYENHTVTVRDSYGSPYTMQVWNYKSFPNLQDSDGDGMLDGKGIYVNGKKIVPADNQRLKSNGPKNAKSIWDNQIEMEKINTEIAREYLDEYYQPIEFKSKIKFLWGFIPYLDNNLIEYAVSKSSEFGSVNLDCRYDNLKVALHSDNTQWQSKWGYNDYYDLGFNLGTSMSRLKLPFKNSDDNLDYVVWAWKGNYLNVGAGTEVGFYISSDEFSFEHWDVSYELSMTLSLYYELFSGNYENVFNWQPYEDQWWITGFNPDYIIDNVKEYQLTQIATVDFSGMGSMYESLKKSDIKENDRNCIIFDDEDKKVWLLW